jgi:hypothetical protein
MPSFLLAEEVLQIKAPQVHLISCKITKKVLEHLSLKEAIHPSVAHELREKIRASTHEFLSKQRLFYSYKMCVMLETEIPARIRYISHDECFSLFTVHNELSYLLTLQVSKQESYNRSEVVFCITEEGRGREISRELFTLKGAKL